MPPRQPREAQGPAETGSQLSLFGDPAPQTNPQEVAPAAPDDRVRALGARLPVGLHLGTSSWSFPGWAGLVYDRKAPESRLSRSGLRAYAAHPVLRAVGLDRTYYAPLPAAGYAEHAAQVPEDFRFVVKAPAAVTDIALREAGGRATARNPRFLDAALARDTFTGPALEGLGPRIGALLFQFPPLGRDAIRDPARFAAALAAFLDALPRGPTCAVELRDRELLTADYFAALAAAGARHCLGVHPRMPPVDEQARHGAALPPGPLIARWNLHAGFAYAEAKAHYAPFDRLVDEDPVTRAALAALCCDALAAGQDAIVIANNKAEGCAPLSAIRLAEAIVGAA